MAIFKGRYHCALRGDKEINKSGDIFTAGNRAEVSQINLESILGEQYVIRKFHPYTAVRTQFVEEFGIILLPFCKGSIRIVAVADSHIGILGVLNKLSVFCLA